MGEAPPILGWEEEEEEEVEEEEVEEERGMEDILSFSETTLVTSLLLLEVALHNS